MHHASRRPRGRPIPLSSALKLVPALLVCALLPTAAAARQFALPSAPAGVHGQPALLMRRAGLRNMPGKLLLSSSLPQVLMRVRHYLGESSTGQPLLTEKFT